MPAAPHRSADGRVVLEVRLRSRYLVTLSLVIVLGFTIGAIAGAAGLGTSGGGTLASLPTPPPTPTIPAGLTSRTVDSVAGLLTALADDDLDEIVVADGTYHVSPAGEQKADSLWIGARYATRTRPIVVRAETRNGVTFDGGGATYFGGISFQDGAHDQTWDGFVFAGGRATDTGIIVFGGYREGGPPAHHITLRAITLDATCLGVPPRDQGIYVSNAAGDGPHDLLFEDIRVDGAGGLASAFAFGHDWGVAAHDVTVRRLAVTGTEQAIILWSTPPLRNITFDGATIRDARKFAIRYEFDGEAFAGIHFQGISSAGSGEGGFFSSKGPQPPGVSFSNNQLQ